MVAMLTSQQYNKSTACTRPVSVNNHEMELIQRTQHGDLDAFNELILAYQDQVYRQAYWILGQPEAAEDAAQEAFFRAYRNIHQYNGVSFRAWVMRIATNYCLDQIRRFNCHPMISLEVPNELQDEEIENPSYLQDPGASPEEMVERAEISAMINDSLMMLAPEYRAAVVMIDVEEMSYQEAASILGMRLGSFKSRLFRARTQLCQIIEKKQVVFERICA